MRHAWTYARPARECKARRMAGSAAAVMLW